MFVVKMGRGGLLTRTAPHRIRRETKGENQYMDLENFDFISLQTIEMLTQPETPIFLTLKPEDAAIIRDAGAHALALRSWDNAETITAILKQTRPGVPIMLTMSTLDENGTAEDLENQYRLRDALIKANIDTLNAVETARALARSGDITQAVHDAIKADEESAKAIVKTALKTVSAETFLKNSFDAERDELGKFKTLKTGWKNIDEKLHLYPGLAALTGRTSLGKTSFAVQLADQLATAGENVMYFSLEQPPVDLVIKSLSRMLYVSAKDVSTKAPIITNIDLQEGRDPDELILIRQKYAKDMAKNLYYVQASFETTADDICSAVRNFEGGHNCKPIVIIDYLQLIAPPNDATGRRMDERAKTDYNIKKLKALSREDGLFILVLSNMARSKYLDRISEESYKESGTVEHTCDYLFGLQLSIMEAKGFYEKAGIPGDADREKWCNIELEKEKRRLVFKCIKQRKGEKVFKAYLVYYPEHDLFEATKEDPDKLLSDAKGLPSDPQTPAEKPEKGRPGQKKAAPRHGADYSGYKFSDEE